MIKGLEYLSYKNMLNELRLFNLKEDFVIAFQYIKGANRRGAEGLLQGQVMIGQGVVALN